MAVKVKENSGLSKIDFKSFPLLFQKSKSIAINAGRCKKFYEGFYLLTSLFKCATLLVVI